MMLVLIALTVAAGTAHGSAVQGQVVIRNTRDFGNAVVYIDKIPGKTFAASAAPVVLDQVNLTFVPHVLPVLVGTRVAFPNSDEIRHNVFSPTPSAKFNLGTYTRGTTRYYVFDKPGPVTLLCNVHAEMSAYVVVTETPYFAVTDKAGRFAIPDVPPGRYVLKAWHEKSRPASIEIEVRDGQPLDVKFELRK
jgi:plastocyanin